MKVKIGCKYEHENTIITKIIICGKMGAVASLDLLGSVGADQSSCSLIAVVLGYRKQTDILELYHHHLMEFHICEM